MTYTCLNSSIIQTPLSKNKVSPQNVKQANTSENLDAVTHELANITSFDYLIPNLALSAFLCSTIQIALDI